jgi:CheY-like chemotaxis protein
MATILIVDDEEPVRDFLAMLMEDAGHRTLKAIHGAQALELVAKERPDLVIADIMMPVLNGVELCRRLNAGTDTQGLPVILMSSTGPRAADGARADAFISKPFVLEEMEALVRRFLPSKTRDGGPTPSA